MVQTVNFVFLIIIKNVNTHTQKYTHFSLIEMG